MSDDAAEYDRGDTRLDAYNTGFEGAAAVDVRALDTGVRIDQEGGRLVHYSPEQARQLAERILEVLDADDE